VRYDALVIGAGMSGLAAGIRLAQAGRRVAILERHEIWGGLNSFYSLGGRRYDVGLHALTNWAAPGTRGAPLLRLLRALRIRHEELELGEQERSAILFPGASLEFSNDLALLESEVARAFPGERDGFARLVERLRAHDLGRPEALRPSARELLSAHLSDPLLCEMLFVAPCFYGNAREDDMDGHAFAILFRSLFLEGLARPAGGIRTLLNLLVRRAKAAGAEIHLSTGVRSILVERGAARGVLLDDGRALEAELILSSAGWAETRALAGQASEPAQVGRLSFLESISVLDVSPPALGLCWSTAFFSARPRFAYRVPEELVDTTSGVLSVPANFHTRDRAELREVRLTVLAHPARWCGLAEPDYRAAKERCADLAHDAASAFVPAWRARTRARDVFTPRTIRHFTGHVNGAVYGAPEKRWSGETEIEGLVLCGTDQGYLGVVGALISGVTMANRHALARAGGGA
jgi:phytoene dehydrogenase-like protein